MSKLPENIEVNGKKYMLTKQELYRAKQIYNSIPRVEKTTTDWKWAVEMALQETQMKEQEKRTNKIE